jgi:general stress protein 26
MKKNNAGTDFYFSKNKTSFWVRDIMAGMQLNICKQGDSSHSLL